MKILANRFLITLAAVYLLAGCDPKFSESVEDFEPSAGDADFSSFVVVGDSLSAGLSDGALFLEVQKNSYPAILAQQFGQAVDADIARAARARNGGIDFFQPLMPEGATGSFVGVPTSQVRDRLVAAASGDPDIPLTPVTITPTQSTPLTVQTGPFNNFGIPGAKSFHLVSTAYGNPGAGAAANPFFIRMASSTGASVIGDAAMRVPTFFLLWIGSNDILSYATSGGTGTDQNAANVTDPMLYGPNDITDDLFFAGVYTGLVATLKTPTNKGLLVNVPKVSSVSFFTTVPYNAIPLTADQAAQLNLAVAGYNSAIDMALAGMAITAEEANRRRLSFSEGLNPVLITDETLFNIAAAGPFAIARHATPDDFILLTASSKIGVDNGGQYGISVPLVDADALVTDGVADDPATGTCSDPNDEVCAIERARAAYNAVIRAAADADPNLILFDAAAMLEELATTGISYGSGGVSSAFIQGGAISLDGIHPTARGYAVVANEFIKAINSGLNANVAPVDPNQFGTLFYQR